MIICVEQRHIDNGLRCVATACPIALAVKEVLKQGYYAENVSHSQSNKS